VSRAISVKKLAEDKAPGYGMKGYTVDGMDFFSCYEIFSEIRDQMYKDSRPVLIETITERFKGHSISDPGLYRSKEALKELMLKDPIIRLFELLKEAGYIDDETYKKIDKEMKEIAVHAMQVADNAPWPNPATLEQDVFAPEGES